jgi:glutaconate CoA-transferase subunit B
MTTEADASANELLAILSARMLRDGQVVFAGIGIPLLAALLAQRTHAPGLTILFEGGVIGAMVEPGRLPPSTNDQRCTWRSNMVLGSSECLLLLQRGYVDVGFMGGAQIDQYGNLNSSFIGADPVKPEVRLPGSGGGNVVTDLAIFGFADVSKCMKVLSLNPGVTRERVQENTGFTLSFAETMEVTEPVRVEELAILRAIDPHRLLTG